MSKLLLVIPAFKESQRLPSFLSELAKVLTGGSTTTDILVIDDGSGKKEQNYLISIIASLQIKYPIILNPICLQRNVGKGGAILAGWDQAKGYDYLGFVDADGAISPKEVERVTETLVDLHHGQSIFGSRIKMLGRTISRGWKRHISGRIFSLIVGIMIDHEVYDSQCGFKLIPQSIYTSVRKSLRGRRFAFDVELLAAIRSSGYNIIEVPIDWNDVPGSKVSLLKDTIRMCFSVIKIRKEIKNGRS